MFINALIITALIFFGIYFILLIFSAFKKSPIRDSSPRLTLSKPVSRISSLASNQVDSSTNNFDWPDSYSRHH